VRFPTLPNAGQPTTPLGFGCARLVGGLEQKRSTRLIQAALDAGISHFDVAPPYGFGTAEDALGIALAGRRREVTIASKAGLARPTVSRSVMLARTLAAPLRKYRVGFTSAVGARVVRDPARQFDVQLMERSLGETLRRLKTDYLDLFLLHEAQPEDLSDGLLKFMEGVRQRGMARAIGVASARTACDAVAAINHQLFDVFQYSWSALDGATLAIPHARFVITHRAILNALRPISDWLADDQPACERLSGSVGFDLGSNDSLADVLLGAALAANGKGIVLAGSRNVRRVHRFGEVMRSEELRAAGTRFVEGLLSEDARPKA
jgi:D-threo-aldose 1-dehydrogenase